MAKPQIQQLQSIALDQQQKLANVQKNLQLEAVKKQRREALHRLLQFPFIRWRWEDKNREPMAALQNFLSCLLFGLTTPIIFSDRTLMPTTVFSTSYAIIRNPTLMRSFFLNVLNEEEQKEFDEWFAKQAKEETDYFIKIMKQREAEAAEFFEHIFDALHQLEKELSTEEEDSPEIQQAEAVLGKIFASDKWLHELLNLSKAAQPLKQALQKTEFYRGLSSYCTQGRTKSAEAYKKVLSQIQKGIEYLIGKGGSELEICNFVQESLSRVSPRFFKQVSNYFQHLQAQLIFEQSAAKAQSREAPTKAEQKQNNCK